MQTTTVFTKHFVAQGNGWVRNDFRTADGQKFSTFDAALANKALALLEVPVDVEYETKNPQYPNSHDFTAIEKVQGSAAESFTPPTPGDDPQYWPSGQVRPVDRSGAIARGLEAFAIAGVDPLAEQKALFELVDDVYLPYIMEGKRPE